jgi:dipeptidyl aminopeptidase/acylaminoacyl peptidase
LNYVLRVGGVQAAVMNSAGYPRELAERAADFHVPLLMLHGTADDPSDGGSALTNVQMARAFEAALRRAGRTVEAVYYSGGHNSIFVNAAQRGDEVQRIASFLRRIPSTVTR